VHRSEAVALLLRQVRDVVDDDRAFAARLAEAGWLMSFDGAEGQLYQLSDR